VSRLFGGIDRTDRRANDFGRWINPIEHPFGGNVATTSNHFGGITVNVSEPGGVNDVIRDLRLHGAALRVRRG